MLKHTLAHLGAATLACALGGFSGCASASAPSPTLVCPTSASGALDPSKDREPQPIHVELSDRTPQLDRGRRVSLEALSSDGALALLEVEDSASGASYRVIEVATEKTRQTFELRALGAREAYTQGLKALGKNARLAWTSEAPSGKQRAFITESRGELGLYLEIAGETRRLATLPRHMSTTDSSSPPTPASVSAVTVAWLPDGQHILAIYRQTTLETPAIEADRWFVVPVRYAVP